MKQIPDKKQIEEMLANSSLQTGKRLDRRLSNAPWTERAVTRRRLVSAASFIVLFAALVFSVAPQGRAFAQKMIRFFAVSEDKSFPIPTDQVYPVPETPTPAPVHTLPLATVESSTLLKTTPTADASCIAPESQAEYFCQIKAVEAQAGFDAKEFLYDPKNLKFSRADFLSESGEIIMEFVTGGGALYLRQGLGDFPLPIGDWGKVPADAVEPVTVNGQYGEIVLGTFVVYPNATEAVWEPGGQLSLAWREGDRWFSLEKFGDPYPIEWITKEEMIKLAESLVDERPPDTIPPLDPENLETIAQAEASAGFDIPTPTQLPEGYELKRIVWMDNIIRLMYGPKDSDAELFIFIGQGVNNQNGPCLECPAGVTETVQVGPWQGWYWRGAFNASATAAPGEPSPTPIWEADYPHWSLVWNTDKYWLSMFYNPAFNSGKEMNRETLIKIAESME
jgi:hypothetical protein